MSNKLNSTIAIRLIDESLDREITHRLNRDVMIGKVSSNLYNKVPEDVRLACVDAVRNMYAYPIESEKRLRQTLENVYVIKGEQS